MYLVCSCSFVFHFPPIRLCSLEKPEAYLSLLNCACDWPNFLGGMYRALGTTSQDPKISRRVNVDYTLSAASSFSQLPHPAGTKFRFVYCSGIAAVRDQEKKLWFLSEGRKIRVCLSNFRPFPRLFIFSLTIPLSPSTPFRPLTPLPHHQGQVETRLLDLSKKYRQSFDPIIVRPAMVLSKESGILRSIMALAPSVKVDELAAAMVEAAVSGSATQTVENERLRLRGRKLLDERVTE